MITDKFNRPLTDLRLSLIDKCNFRCTYCMPAHINHRFLAAPDRLNVDEFKRLISLFASMGVRKIRLTGGEPLLFPDLKELITYAKGVQGIHEVCLTTNGSLLAAQAIGLKQAGLDRITISLDSLDAPQFAAITGGRVPLSRVLDGIDATVDAGFENTKINAVIQRGVNEDEIVPLASFARERAIIMRFIEFMDVGTVNKWDLSDVIVAADIVKILQQKWQVEPAKRIEFGEVASRYYYGDTNLEVGVIPSISKPFCGSCVRARVSAKGEFFNCLFASKGFDIRALLRGGASDESICSSLGYVWERRDDRYSEEREEMYAKGEVREKVEMMSVGG